MGKEGVRVSEYGTLLARENSHNVLDAEADGERLASPWHATVVTVKAVVGSGFLALPFAMRASGLVGVPILVVVWLLTTYTTKLLVRIAKLLLADDADTDVSYTGLIDISLTGAWRAVAMAAFVIAQYSAVITYVVLVNATLLPIVEGFEVMDAESASNSILLACLIIEGLIALLPSPAFLEGVSSFGNLVFCASICVIVVFCVTYSPPKLSNVKVFESLGGCFVNFGISCFTMAAHAEALAIFGSCNYKTRLKYEDVVEKSIAAAAILFLCISLLAYASFGEDSHQDIFENISGNGSEAINVSVKLLICLMVLCNYPLCLFPIHALVQQSLNIEPTAINGFSIMLRESTVFFSILIAFVFGTRFGIVSTLAGACTGVLSFILPPILYVEHVYGGKWGNIPFGERAKLYFVLVAGIVGSAMALYEGLSTLYAS